MSFYQKNIFFLHRRTPLTVKVLNPKATERNIKVQNPNVFPFSFKTVGFLADFLVAIHLDLMK